MRIKSLHHRMKEVAKSGRIDLFLYPVGLIHSLHVPKVKLKPAIQVGVESRRSEHPLLDGRFLITVSVQKLEYPFIFFNDNGFWCRHFYSVGQYMLLDLYRDRKSTRLSSHVKISYAVFCLKKK